MVNKTLKDRAGEVVVQLSLCARRTLSNRIKCSFSVAGSSRCCRLSMMQKRGEGEASSSIFRVCSAEAKVLIVPSRWATGIFSLNWISSGRISISWVISEYTRYTNTSDSFSLLFPLSSTDGVHEKWIIGILAWIAKEQIAAASWYAGDGAAVCHGPDTHRKSELLPRRQSRNATAAAASTKTFLIDSGGTRLSHASQYLQREWDNSVRLALETISSAAEMIS